MKKTMKLRPDHLRVDSFPTEELPRDGMAPGIVTTVPRYTCPECASPVND
ncbi:hypothetical protein [Longimicrobium sp.]|nr:hypothetical protein [Longimicrobium sp.]HSU16774.1 hypothetical protein [Longimicrobium sp.]